MKTLLIATNNSHKFKEIKEILKPLKIHVIKPQDLGLNINIVEDGLSYQANALIKAKAYHRLCDLPVLADDSGLEILALDRQPGIYSARYLGEDTPYADKNQTILSLLKQQKNRAAEFVSALAFILPNGKHYLIEQRILGIIASQSSGNAGFGYDPIFEISPNKTLADLSEKEKNQLSHRALALQAFMKLVNEKGWVEKDG